MVQLKKRLKMKMLKKQECKCKMCNGVGQYEDFFDDIYGGTHSIGLWECPYCNGTGKVNALDEFKSDIRVEKILKELF